MFQVFLKRTKTYSPDEIDLILDETEEYFQTINKNKQVKYINIPCAFDIETTSFSPRPDEYRAIMYEWTFGIYGCVIIGRTWNEFMLMINRIVERLKLSTQNRLICYVHNLSFEFQFIRKRFTWKKVFAIENLKPVYAVTESGIEFRCSYILSGYSLKHLAENLTKYHIKKLTGDLDYTLLRHTKTVLTSEELQYCINDVKIVMAYIDEEMTRNGNIAGIPLTKTSYARRYCRFRCFQSLTYRKYIRGLILDVEEYKQLRRAFQGGFTHCNAFYNDVLLNDITSYDFTSSYPAVMIAEKFPASNSELIEIHSTEELKKNLKLYCCLFDVTFYGLEQTFFNENYISISHCRDVKRPTINNGRVAYADEITTTITEQDFEIIKRVYKWDKMRISNFRRYKRDYLPREFVDAILTLYEKKTELKGVEGKEEYMYNKELLNSLYGMIVTNIIRDENVYINDEWQEKIVRTNDEFIEKLSKYNRDLARFTFYPVGVWVTAYARKNLFTGILAAGNDYVYSDTDSIKIRNGENHKSYIDGYNAMIYQKLENAMNYHGFSIERIKPKTRKGEEKIIGVWDFDGKYDRFKTLGAKRYMTETDNGLSITVAGLNKNIAVPFICRGWCYDLSGQEINSPFEKFKRGLYIPADYTGKMTHRYLHDEQHGFLTDYTGQRAEYDEKSSVHLENTDYSLSMAQEYISFINSIRG